MGFVIDGDEISDAAAAQDVSIELRRESFWLNEGGNGFEYSYVALDAMSDALATVKASGRYREWKERQVS